MSVSPESWNKENWIQDMSIPFEPGDMVLANQDVDENLRYNPLLRPFVRGWLEFGNGNSPDLLDATYYALQYVEISRGDDLNSEYATDIYNRRSVRALCDKQTCTRPVVT